MFSTKKKGFLLSVKRQQQVPLNLIGIVSDLVLLVYPRDDKFIRELPVKDVSRLVKYGWDIEKTLFFEVPYIMSFSYNLEPSLASNFILDVVPKKSYFKCLVFTKEYVIKAHQIELEDTILHEKSHLFENESKFRIGNIKAADPYLEKEKIVSDTVKRIMEDKYESLHEQVEFESIKFAFNLQSKRYTIISGILEFWLWKFLQKNFNKYKEFSNPIHYLMQAELEKLNPKIIQNTTKIYNELFNFNIK